MQVPEIISNYQQTGVISDSDINRLTEEGAIRAELYRYFTTHKNRPFVIALLNRFMALRSNPKNLFSGDHLMYASYLVGLHQQVEDCLLIWKAKGVDFDSFCYVDIQLMLFAGLESTIQFLQLSKDEEAKAALKYIQSCNEHSDFQHIEEYFSKENLPWWLAECAQ